MAYTYPLKASDMKTIERRKYATYLKGTLKMKLNDGAKLPFCLVLNHVYPKSALGKSIQLPFFLFGPPKSKDEWAAFKKDGGGDNQGGKPIAMVMGVCTRKGNHITLNINSKGDKNKIPQKYITNLQKIITATKLGLTIDVKEESTDNSNVAGAAVGGGTKQEQTSDTKTSNTNETATTENKEKPKEVTEEKKEKLVQKYKEEKQGEAKKLAEQFGELDTISSSAAIKKVTANIKRGRTTKKDLKAVKELNKVFSTTEKLYKKTAKQIQKKFDKPYKELAKNKKKFYQLSLATKQSKKGVAETLASNYYQKKRKRAATKDEVKEIQKIAKDVILMNKKRRKKAKQNVLFKATSYVLKNTGPKKFKAKYVNQILQKKVV